MSLAGRVVQLGPSGRDVVAAALLHDVGKVKPALGTWARAGVTFAAMGTGRERTGPLVENHRRGDSPTRRRARRASWRSRIGLYLRHDAVGAELLSEAGSDPLTVAWAGEHHRPPQRWSVDARLGAALKLADDD